MTTLKTNGGWHRAATRRRKKLLKLALTVFAVVLATACGAQTTDEGQVASDRPVNSTSQVAPGDFEVYSVGYTYAGPSGNRYISGTGRFGTEGAASATLRIDVSGEIDSPVWLNAAPHPEGGVVWIVTGADGKSVAYRIGQDAVSVEISIDYSAENFSLVPPVLVVGDNGQIQLTSTREATGLATLLQNTLVEFVDDEAGNGDLRITRGDTTSVTSLRNAPDATFIIGDDLTIYSYSDSTERYPHGAMGDKNEWGGMWAIPVDDGAGATHLLLEESEVFEGLYPMLADIDGDGVQEIIGTVSSLGKGARLIVMKKDATGIKVVGLSEPIGSQFRWTHQIVVAPFGPDGEMELATIRTPHIGGVAEFYRLKDGKLERVASLSGGYSSHVNGSRNLDMAIAGDFDGDGRVELLVPSRDRKLLVALRRTADSVEEVWQLSLGSPLATNLAGVELPDGPAGRIGLGAVTADGVLLIWQ